VISLSFGDPVVVAGVAVPTPPLLLAYWFEDVAAVMPARSLVYSSLSLTARTVDTEGGTAQAVLGVDDTGVAGLQVQITYAGVWDVVLVDSFEDSLCPGINTSDPLNDVTRVFMGRGDAGSIVRLTRGHQELGTTIEAFVRPNVVAPGGIGARCLFQNVYLAVESATGGLVRLTPVVDGEVLTDEAIIFAVPSDGATRYLRRFEIPLGRSHTVSSVVRSRGGIVGTWFTFEAEVLDAFGCGRLEFGGSELEFAVLEESVPGQVFTGESLSVPLSAPVQRWFVGSGSLFRGDDGVDDGGAAIEVRMRTNEIAWAGIGGEALYQNVYIAITRLNASDWTFRVTPIVDDEDLTAQSFTLLGVAQPVTEVLEVSLAQTRANGKSTYWPRGCWLALLIEADTAPDKDVIFEGWSPEAETLTESLEHADA
jgi:hypothetical protein